MCQPRDGERVWILHSVVMLVLASYIERGDSVIYVPFRTFQLYTNACVQTFSSLGECDIDVFSV